MDIKAKNGSSIETQKEAPPPYEHDNAKVNFVEKLAARTLGAESIRIANTKDDNDLINHVTALCAAIRIKKVPKILIAEADTPHAENISLCDSILFTSGLIKLLSQEELDAVVSRELVHFHHEMSNLIDDAALEYLEHEGMGIGAAEGVRRIAANVINGESRHAQKVHRILNHPGAELILDYYGGELVHSGLHLGREATADREGAELTSPHIMISALEKIAAKEKEHSHVKRDAVGTALHIGHKILHPFAENYPTETRVKMLQALEEKRNKTQSYREKRQQEKASNNASQGHSLA